MWDSNPRPHSWTRTLKLNSYFQPRGNLESGALDRSANLTANETWVLTLEYSKGYSHAIILGKSSEINTNRPKVHFKRTVKTLRYTSVLSFTSAQLVLWCNG